MKSVDPNFHAEVPGSPHQDDLATLNNSERAMRLKARLCQKALEAIALAPETRSEKVEPIKAALQQNKYRIDASRTAGSLIFHLLSESYF